MKAMTNVFAEMSWRACAAQGAATLKSQAVFSVRLLEPKLSPSTTKQANMEKF